MRNNDMSEKIIRIHAPQCNQRLTYRDDTPIGVKLDMLTLRALDELVVDVMEERGVVPPKQPWEIKQ